ncbi:ATP-binding protein [Arthrobacter sp. Y-9]|uniref:ATP-binding protein n=1 Tax=Arthrobacter sp. Y-9 TaxID=3039385 RepID=UPI00241E816A|nr:ATP-binding protein [Arthrobacter sp. Y-9]WFR83890.1 ATP-binding protein [Arthrobacter sp. Y-9]
MDNGPKITRTRDVPPDPSIAQAVGRHHSFETAIADLVDNSIDAGAKNILVRFLEEDGAVVGLRLIDDGRGMDDGSIDDAMTFARKRDYQVGDLGHFGLGLKAASLSQADILRVYSRRNGAPSTGRMIEASEPTKVSDLDTDEVDDILGRLRVDFAFPNGTVVEWSQPRTFLSSEDGSDRARWLDARINSVTSHLGVVFHRLLASGAVRIGVEVFDVEYSESGVPRQVQPIDPFGYSRLPNDDYPARIQVSLDGTTVEGRAHIWPAAQSGRPEFRLGGKPGALAQGFYFYRADRLLQIGGWNTLTVNRPELEYARIELDIAEPLGAHITINPEKAGLELDSDLRHALRHAVVGAQGMAFSEFLEAAAGSRAEARKYTKRPVELVEPGRGFGADLIDAFESSVERVAADPVDIRWQVELTEAPIRVDLDRRTIWLNEQYRDVIAGPNSMDAADAPFVKTLLMIVYSKYFEGSHLGPREKAEISAWEQLLTAALREELSQQSRKLGENDE